MKKRRFTLIGLGMILVATLLIGCQSPSQAAELPTSTPPPPQIAPTATATELPPPTVTPFPTATVASSPEATITATVEATTAPAETAALTETTAPTDTATPTILPTATSADFERGGLIFSADFSQGWPTIDEAGATISIQQGQYVFNLGHGTLRYVTSTAAYQSDQYAEIDATPQSCPTGAGYGLFFRFQDSGNYYALTFFCDGRVTVYMRSGDNLITQPLVDTTLPAGLDAASSSTHVLGVLAKGSDFKVYFDGQTVASFHDETLATGDIAMYASNQGAENLIVAFDNLEMWAVR